MLYTNIFGRYISSQRVGAQTGSTRSWLSDADYRRRRVNRHLEQIAAIKLAVSLEYIAVGQLRRDYGRLERAFVALRKTTAALRDGKASHNFDEKYRLLLCSKRCVREIERLQREIERSRSVLTRARRERLVKSRQNLPVLVTSRADHSLN